MYYNRLCKIAVTQNCLLRSIQEKAVTLLNFGKVNRQFCLYMSVILSL